MICSTLASLESSNLFRGVFTPFNIYGAVFFFCENRQCVLTQGIIQRNNLGVGRSLTQAKSFRFIWEVWGGGGAFCKLSQLGVFWGRAPLQNCLIFQGVIDWLKIYPHFIVFFFLFFSSIFFMLFLLIQQNKQQKVQSNVNMKQCSTTGYHSYSEVYFNYFNDKI